MKVLILNSGSSSLKYQLIDMPKEKVLLRGHADEIGRVQSKLIVKYDGSKEEKQVEIKNHEIALKLAFESLKQYDLIDSYNDIDAVGHRVVHGGSKYKSSVKISAAVIKNIKDLCSLAPLHNPANLAGIIASQKLLKKQPQFAVFDTSFHQTMSEAAYTYPLPRTLCKEEKIRKYGFHGISHKYVSGEAYKLMKKKKGGIITCHLGNGCSVAAIQDGFSVETSMGFTPAAGIFMGTRTGSIDPGIFTFLLKEKKYSVAEWNHLINKESGFKGLTDYSDVRVIYQRSNRCNRAKSALEMFSHKLAFFISGYSAFIETINAIVFTAGIGENAFYIRARTLDMLAHLGVKYDKRKNESNALDITGNGSKVKIYIIPTNEELEIAREVNRLMK